MRNSLRRCRALLLCLAILIATAAAGCSPAAPSPSHGFSSAPTVSSQPQGGDATLSPAPSPTPTATPAPLKVASAEAVADPSVAAAELADPYSEICKYTVQIFSPDHKLYNDLYRAVVELKSTFDVSGYKLKTDKKIYTAECLYSDTSYRLFYLKSVKISNNGKQAKFTYTKEKPESIRKNSIRFDARLSHLLYNVLPEDYSDLQKLVSLYDYLCRTSDYAAKEHEESTMSPYSILMNGQGICWGYANLTQMALSHAGVAAEYVCCGEVHAWNIVKLDGNWYHTDVTWGAGRYGSSDNYLNTLLMDDKKRAESFSSQNYAKQPVTVGYPNADAPAMPPCTDSRFDAYSEIYGCYALDVDGGKVYFRSPDGLERMNLDCTGRETISKALPTLMAYFNGTVYYADANDGFLYSLVPGGEPKLLDGNEMVLYLALDGTTLKYGPDGSGAGCKRLELLPLGAAAENAQALPAAAIPAGRSFRLRIAFSAPASGMQNWNELVFLVDSKGKTIPLHFALSKDGKELTVRPKECPEGRGSLSLVVKAGVASVSGGLLQTPCRMDITLG